MTRKGKAFLIGFLVPMVLALLGGIPFVAGTMPQGEWAIMTAIALIVAAILVGGLTGMIASVCTSGPPMSRKAKAALIGFYSPVIPGCGLVMLGYLEGVRMGPHEYQVMSMLFAMMIFGAPSILLGLVIALCLAIGIPNKLDPQRCGKCGYSLVGLTCDKCPECGHTVSTTATA